LEIAKEMPAGTFDAAILAVAHDAFKDVKINSKLTYQVKDFQDITG
jgi:hypothetical protein